MSWILEDYSNSQIKATKKEDPTFRNELKWFKDVLDDKITKEGTVLKGDGKIYQVIFSNQVILNLYALSLSPNEDVEGWVAFEICYPDKSLELLTTKEVLIAKLKERSLYHEVQENKAPKVQKEAKAPKSVASVEVSPLMIKILATSLYYLKLGFSLNEVPRDLELYRLPVTMKMTVASTLKSQTEFYKFLDDVRLLEQSEKLMAIKSKEQFNAVVQAIPSLPSLFLAYKLI